MAEQELAVRRQPTAELWEAGMSLISKGEGAASEGWSNAHTLCTNTRLRTKGFPYLSQPGVPASGEHPCWGLRLSTATPRVPSHVPSVNPAVVVSDLCYLLTKTLRHREGKKLVQGHGTEKSRSPQQAGQDSHLLLSSFTMQPSLHQPGWRIRGRGKVLPTAGHRAFKPTQRSYFAE